MPRHSLVLVLLSACLATAWVQPGHTRFPIRAVEALTTRLSAFQVPATKKNFPSPNDNDYEPYDWENDRLEYVDEESERPWAIDRIPREPLTIRTRQDAPPRQKPALMRWNPFAKLAKPHVPQPPINSRARLSTTDAGTLVIDLPATGIDSKTISSGIFGTLWFSAIAPATLAGGFATAAFLLPFWLAGGFVAKTAIVDPFVKSQLTIGQYAWSLKSSYANAKLREVDGSTQDLRGASVEDLNVEVNGKPFYEIKLYGDKGTTGFGNGLEPEELEYLAYVINQHLQGLPQDESENSRDDDVYGFISGRRQD